WGPYAFFRALEETRSNAQEAGPSVSEANVLSTEVPVLDSSLDDPHLTSYDPESGHVSKLCIVFLPLLIASLVGISRVDDYWHHWQDVFAGALIGITMAAFCYLQFFAPPYHTEGYLKMKCGIDYAEG
nr:putative lipid phosphate phosphatase 3, chloroplastic isoform X3 [Tanacetum cinerariifolium]